MSTMQDMLEARRPGWLTFAAMVMIAVGVLRVISAIYYFADSARINNSIALGAFSDNLFLWGIWDLVIALLALWAGYSLLSGNTFGRVIGYVWAMLVIIQSFMIIGVAPWFATAMLVLASLVIYALAVTVAYRGGTWTETDIGAGPSGV
jgi:hypothetical protein